MEEKLKEVVSIAHDFAQMVENFEEVFTELIACAQDLVESIEQLEEITLND